MTTDENNTTETEEYIDLTNLDALEEAMQPARGEYPLTLPSGAKILIPYRVGSFAAGMEASRGERFKENEVNDPDKTRRIYMRRINACLLDGWHIVDDMGRKLGSPAQLIREHKIPISIIRSSDWSTLNEVIFPGAVDSAEIVKDRAAAIRNAAVQSISSSGNSEPSGSGV